MYGGDEVGALVFDIGSHSMRAGYAGEDMPKADIPSTVGFVPITDMETDQGETAHQNRIGDKKYYFDTTQIKVPREDMEMSTFMSDGMIEDWDVFEKIMDHLYEKHMRCKTSEHPVMMSECSWNIRAKRERLTELMFEKYNIPAFFLCKNAVLSCFANSRPTGVVLDSGLKQTSAVPVFDGYVIQNAIVKTPLAGEFVTTECQKLMDELKIEVVPPYMIKSKEVVDIGKPACWTKKSNLPSVTKSFDDMMIRDMMQDFAATTLQVLEGPYDQEPIDNMPSQEYEFASGLLMEFGSERMSCVEKLFDPSYIKDIPLASSMLGMGPAVTTAVGMCDIDIRPSLYSSVIVCGGNSLINGFTDRLNRDLTTKTPPSMRLKLIHSSVSAERRFSSWIGGSILASLGSFQQMWISKQEYDEGGKSCVEKKCP